jgi:hypothetical protein
MPSNLSAHTDTQQQIAAARRLLGAGSLERKPVGVRGGKRHTVS